MVTIRCGRAIPCDAGYVVSFNSTNFAVSAALSEVCALLSAILINSN